jgi:hypothetical protein
VFNERCNVSVEKQEKTLFGRSLEDYLDQQVEARIVCVASMLQCLATLHACLLFGARHKLSLQLASAPARD